MNIFSTSFCNFGHNTSTGRPVGHECYILPVAMLKAEQRGDFDEANRILASVDFKRRGTVQGKRAPITASSGNVYDKPIKYHKKLGLYTVKLQDATADLPALYDVTFDGGDRAIPYGVVEKYKNQQRYHAYTYSHSHSADLGHISLVNSFVSLEEALQGLSDHHDNYPTMG